MDSAGGIESCHCRNDYFNYAGNLNENNRGSTKRYSLCEYSRKRLY